MALVFRTDQTTPLTNDQVDNNFKYLRDEINLKYSISDFTAPNISLKLRTTSGTQTSYQLAQANALNAWAIRDLEPSSTLPVTSDKSSIVSRNSSGNIVVGTVTGNLTGNASSATVATTAGKLTNAVNINGVAFDGSTAITVADSTKLPLSGGTMTGKLNLVNVAYLYAPINLGIAAPDANAKVNGDLWATPDGLFYHAAGTTNQVAQLQSPTFTGIPKAPGYSSTPDQIATLSHLSATQTTLQNSINLKAALASPGLTGTPTAPTAGTGTNTTQIATTAFVKTAVDTKATELTSSYQSYTNSAITTYSNAVNTLLAAKAALASPELTGTPTAPTASQGTNTTQIATTAFINSAVAALQANLNSAVAALNDAIASTRPVPVASVFYIATSTVPYGYLEANGQAISKLTYNDLWVALGSPAPQAGDPVNTFRIPDLRGEFIRGWDHGRGMDYGRTIGSWQIGSLHLHNDDSDGFTGGCWSNMWTEQFGYDYDTTQRGSGKANQMGYDSMTFEWLAAYAATTPFNWSSNNPPISEKIDWRFGNMAEPGISLLPNALAKSNHWIYMGRPRNVALMPIIKW